MRYLHVLIAILLLLPALGGCATPAADPPTDPARSSDIWLFEWRDSQVDLVTRITDSAGYDNQPVFMPDGRSILFSSDRTGRVETWSYDLESGMSTQITDSPADKFSPTLIPGTGRQVFSVVYDDTLSTPPVKQGLWRFSLDGSIEPAPLADVDMVAYYTWVDADRVLIQRLGAPNTVQLLDTSDSSTEVIEEGLALSLHPIPGEEASSYFVFVEQGPAVIKRFDWATGETSEIAEGLHGSKYFCWTPDGTLLMIGDGTLYAFTPGQDTDWHEVAYLGLTGDSRVAVSPDGRLLAVTGSHTLPE